MQIFNPPTRPVLQIIDSKINYISNKRLEIKLLVNE